MASFFSSSSTPLCSILPFNNPSPAPHQHSFFFQRSLASAGALVSSSMAPATALAVSYNDVLENVTQAQRELPLQSLDVDVGATLDSVLQFINGNPLAIISGVTAVSVLVLASRLLGRSDNWGFASARDAFRKLGDEQAQAQLIDIRDAGTRRAEGSPDLRSYKKKGLQIAFSKDSAAAFLQKALAKIKNPADTTVYILDKFDKNSIEAAKLLATNGFKSAYAIKDGAEGPTGWQKSQLPWLVPQNGLLFDIGALKDAFDNRLNENPDLVPTSLGVAAAAGVGLVVFSEAETALQLVGSVALVQLFLKKFLFAKDRKKTLEELQVFLDTKVAPQELVDEIKGIGKGFLPNIKQVTIESGSNGALTTRTAELIESQVTTSEVKNEPSLDSLKNEDGEKVFTASPLTTSYSNLPYSNRPLSPYPQYPDLKPPTSPTPSTP